MQLKTGDIVLVDTEGIIPSTIDKFQGNDWNHALMIIRVYGVTYAFEAIDSGIAFRPFSYYTDRVKSGEDIRLLSIRHKKDIWKDISDVDLMNFCLPLTEGHYAYGNLTYKQIIKYTWKKIFGKELWVGGTAEEVIEKGNYICGQLVCRIYNRFFNMFPKWVSSAPVDIFNHEDFTHKEIK
jgi:hypothetical protein